MDRKATLLETSDRSSRIIEIGPSHAPIAPKAAGWNTTVVDYTSREELRRKFAQTGDGVEAIEEVDVIWNGGALDAAVPAALHGSFDTLIASHVLEHIPDLAGFFIAAGRLLKPTGSMALAQPDLRYCFDCFRPPATTGEVLAAHLARASRHNPASAFDHTAYSVSQAGVGAWGQHPAGDFSFRDTIAAARRHAEIAAAEPAHYADYHAWPFTPARFELVILELAQLGVIDWRVARMRPAAGCEFIVTLRPGREPFADQAAMDARRMHLLLASLAEAREQIDFVLGDGAPPRVTEKLGAIDARLGGVDAGLARMTQLLEEQRVQVRDIAEVSAWQRRLLAPAAAGWRRLRRRRPQ